MNDEKKYTERDMIMAQRAAYVARAVEGSNSEDVGYWGRRAEEEAKARYPLPKVPRELKDDKGTRWRISDDCLERFVGDDCWAMDLDLRYGRRHVISELFVNPWEDTEP